MNDKVKEIEDKCEAIQKKYSSYQFEALKFFAEVCAIKEKLGTSTKDAKLVSFLDERVRIVQKGLESKKYNLMEQYTDHLELLLELKRDLLNSENSSVVSLGNRLAKDIKSLKGIISDFKKEINNVKGRKR